jgi:uncharacterized protein DUF3617
MDFKANSVLAQIAAQPAQPFAGRALGAETINGRTWKVIKSLLWLCVAAAAFAVAPVSAEAPALNVRTGLWEMTVQLGAPPPLPKGALERLPPGQRAQMEAMLGAITQPHTMKTCLTKEKLSRGALEQDESNRPCKRTVVSNSPKALDLKVECTFEEGTKSTSLHFEAPTPEMLTGTSVIARMTREGPETTTGTFQGKWVGPACGSVK